MENTSMSSGSSGIFPGSCIMSGSIPPSGIFSVKRWAEVFDVDEGTIRRWVKQYEIPFFKPGACMFIDAVDFIRRLPYINREDE